MEDGRQSRVTLRAAQTADEGLLRAVYASTRAEELAVTAWSEEQKSEFCRRQFAAQDAHYRKHYPTAQLSVIQQNGAPVGRLYVDRWEKEIRIMDIALLPEHRRRGIGTRLLRALQDEARAASKVLSIHVERFNPALRLYERLGFKRTSVDGVYYLMKWVVE